MNWPTGQQLAGIGRDFIKYSSVLVTTAGAIALLPQDQVQALLSDLQHLQNAGKEIALAFLGPGGFIMIGTSVWTYYLNSHKAVVQAAAAVPGTTVVAPPELADTTPQDNIVSSAEVKVVPK